MSKHKGRKSGRRGVTRREFLAGAAATAGFALTGCAPGSNGAPKAAAAAGALPAPDASGIDHVVVVMMENRSFDHFLGWVPGANGVQAGVTQLDSNNKPQQSFNLAPPDSDGSNQLYQNCNLADPDHSYDGGHLEVNGGKMDGFLKLQQPGDKFPIGYYTGDRLPFFKGCAENWTICDNYFCSILSSTTPNRIYMHAGQTDRLSNSTDVSTLDTIWDRMKSVGKSTAYYYTDVSYVSFWGNKYLDIAKKYSRQSFASEIAALDTLPALTFVDNVGNTLNEGGAFSIDDHPYSDIRDGQAFLNDVYNAFRAHKDWGRTLFIINYDEWGGFYDHVVPPIGPMTPAEAALGNDGRLGCRVPCVIVGPFAKRGHVDSTQFDHNSILNMLAWRFGFAPLGARGTFSGNIATALDFTTRDASTPRFDVPAGPFHGLCVPIQFMNNHSSPIQSPAPVPNWPVPPIGPLPVELQMPSIPGFDVPVFSTPEELQQYLEDFAAQTSAVRAAHEAELQSIRDLGASFGF